MKKKIALWITVVIIGIILVIMVFLGVDIYRMRKGEVPIFAIKKELSDNNTIEYHGLGYTWVYNPNQPQDKTEDKAGSNTQGKYLPLEQLPKDYTFKQAFEDGCVIISYQGVYHKQKLDEFIANTEKNSKNRIPDSIRIIQYTVEGDMIITDLEYTKEGRYKVRIDNTRDKFSAKEDRIIITKEDFPGEFYKMHLTQEGENIKIELALYETTDDIDNTSKIYQNYVIVSYLNSIPVYETAPTFIATIIKAEENFILVEPVEGENIRKSSDKISVGIPKGVKQAEYKTGTKVKITYTGIVLESYPAQIDILHIESLSEN